MEQSTAETASESEPPTTRTDGDAPHDALRAIFEDRYAQLVALADVMLRDRMEAEDVVQDAFAAVMRRGDAVGADPAGYVVQAVVNGARSRLRRREVERRPRPVAPDVPSDGDDGHLLDLVRRLPRRQAQAIVCRFVLDLTFPETARVLGISRRAARTHVDRGLTTLDTWIQEETR